MGCAKEVERILQVFCHPYDDNFAEAFTQGVIPGAQAVAPDVRNNRELRGNCPQCAAGKMHQHSMPSSLT